LVIWNIIRIFEYKQKDMITFDPNNPLTDDDLTKLSEEDFISYLDQLSLYKRKDKKVVSQWKKKGHEILKKTGVKNVKTNRTQWFD
jgi:hypothetical protein